MKPASLNTLPPGLNGGDFGTFKITLQKATWV
mgnify:CR=1 FL=1